MAEPVLVTRLGDEGSALTSSAARSSGGGFDELAMPRLHAYAATARTRECVSEEKRGGRDEQALTRRGQQRRPEAGHGRLQDEKVRLEVTHGTAEDAYQMPGGR